MKTFSVELEKVLVKDTIRYEVNSDSSFAGGQYGVEGEDTATAILIGYSVMEREDSFSLSNVEFYPIVSDTNAVEVDDTGDRVYKNNSLEVLEKIKEDYPPEEWECFNW